MQVCPGKTDTVSLSQPLCVADVAAFYHTRARGAGALQLMVAASLRR